MKIFSYTLFLIIVLVLWHLIAIFFSYSVLPTPYEVLKTSLSLIATGAFTKNALQTMIRVSIGFTAAFSLGSIIGMVMGFNKKIEKFLALGLVIGLTIPGIIWAIIALIWFGPSSIASVTAAMLLVTPLIAVNVLKGAKSINLKLIEMAKVFNVKKVLVVKDVILPQLMPFFFSSARYGFALSWKATIIVEVMGLNGGVGYMINRAFNLFSMREVLAWVVLFVCVMIFIENFVFMLLEKSNNLWRIENGNLF